MDELRMRADGRHADVFRHARLLGEMSVVDVEFDQGLGMLRHEAQRIEHDAFAVRSGPADLRLGRRADPFQWADPALVTDRPLDAVEMLADRRRGLLDLALVGIALPDD